MAEFTLQSDRTLLTVEPNLGVQFEDKVTQIVFNLPSTLAGISLSQATVSLALEDFPMVSLARISGSRYGVYLPSELTQKAGTLSVQVVYSIGKDENMQVARSELAYGLMKRSQSVGDEPIALYPTVLLTVERILKEMKEDLDSVKQAEANAKKSEQNAKSSADEAAASAKSAATSAGSAATDAAAAKAARTGAEAAEKNAKASETAAKTSETNAKASETAAKASETAAKTSETNAKASETAAKASEEAAKASETAAAASEQAAALSEQNAALSEQNAAASEQNAAASEQAAALSEQNAARSEQNAAASEQAAAASEQAAAQSEQNAAASEQAAEDSATLSRSWAVGDTETRGGEETDNSKYYAQQSAKSATESALSAEGLDVAERNATTAMEKAIEALSEINHLLAERLLRAEANGMVVNVTYTAGVLTIDWFDGHREQYNIWPTDYVKKGETGNASEVRFADGETLQDKLDSGVLNGKDGVLIEVSGFYSLYVDDNGDLILATADDTEVPPLYIDENGDLIWEEGHEMTPMPDEP